MKTMKSVRRIVLLAEAHWNARWKLYAASYAILVLLLITTRFFEPNTLDILPVFYVLLLCFVGCLQAANIFGSWTDKNQAMHFITLPAKTIEKFIVAFLFTTILFVPIFSLVYMFTTYGIVSLLFEKHTSRQLTDTYILFFNANSIGVLAWVFTLIQSVFLFGSVFFKNRQFVKSGLVLVAFFLLFALLPQYAVIKLTGIKFNTSTFFFVDNLAVYSKIGAYENGWFELKGVYSILNSIVWLIVPLGLFVASYFKLKEKEI